MRYVVIFGIGKMAATVTHYMNKWKIAEPAAYTTDPQYLRHKEFQGRPVVPLDDISRRFPPEDHDAFVALGYQDLNALRTRKFEYFKELGYRCLSVVNPEHSALSAGENCLVIPGEELIEPFVVLGDNSWVWNGASISHFAQIGRHTWISNGAMIGGNAKIGDGSFLGFGAVVSNNISVGDGCLVGSGAIVLKDLTAGTAVISETTSPVGMDALRVARLFLR